MTATLSAFVPVRLGRGLNDREHAMDKHRRAKREQEAAYYALQQACGLRVKPHPPVRVTMTRACPSRGKKLDDDNLVGSLKGVRDGIAKWLNVNDADERVQWVPEQRTDEQWCCYVVIEEVRDAPQADAADST